jgi:hypothetical protein
LSVLRELISSATQSAGSLNALVKAALPAPCCCFSSPVWTEWICSWATSIRLISAAPGPLRAPVMVMAPVELVDPSRVSPPARFLTQSSMSLPLLLVASAPQAV